jgi:hypothetical protein
MKLGFSGRQPEHSGGPKGRTEVTLFPAWEDRPQAVDQANADPLRLEPTAHLGRDQI